MTRTGLSTILLSAGLAVCLSTACGEKSTKPDPASMDKVPDFALTDVNPNSSRHGEVVSPRDYLGKISCYYFGHAT